MGKHSRTKGRSFEQLVANAYRKRWPLDCTVRRSLQSDRAYEPDVVVEGHHLGCRFWTECNHADDPQPLVKLAQAERDLAVASKTWSPKGGYLPLVVWRKSGSRVIHVTTRMWVLQELGGHPARMEGWSDLVVTMDFQAFLHALGA